MKTPPAVGSRVYIPTERDSAYLVGEVIAPPRFRGTRAHHVWVSWEGTPNPSLVDIEMLAPLPKQHFREHVIARVEVDERTGDLICSTCRWSIFRYSLTGESPGRAVVAKAL